MHLLQWFVIVKLKIDRRNMQTNDKNTLDKEICQCTKEPLVGNKQTNKVQISASAQCNSLQTPMVAERLFEPSLEKGVDNKDKSIIDKPQEITAIPFEKVPTAMVHATRLIRSQPVKLTDSCNCFPKFS